MKNYTHDAKTRKVFQFTRRTKRDEITSLRNMDVRSEIWRVNSQNLFTDSTDKNVVDLESGITSAKA